MEGVREREWRRLSRQGFGPGEATLQLPAGKVKLTYQERVFSPQASGRIEFCAPQSLRVAITPGQPQVLLGR